jgi:hypothetical protein
LVTEVHQQLVAAAGSALGASPAQLTGDNNNTLYALRRYGGPGPAARTPELQAELFNPALLSVAQRTPFDASQLSPGAQRALTRMTTVGGAPQTLFDAIAALVQDVLSWFSNNPTQVYR